jgi:nucleotide-binding universal stress UspA family protein
MRKERTMIQKIMVPLDGTRFAEAALPYAMYLAKRDGAALQLATVWQPLPVLIETREWQKQLDEWEESRRTEDRRYLTEVARRAGKALGRTVSVRYMLGRPAEELASQAEESRVDLMVMATHGRGTANRMWLGSVADGCVRGGTVPVLLVRPRENLPEVEIAPARPFHKILVPLDGSTLAERALRKSLLAGSSPATTEITLLAVVGFPVPMPTPEGGVALDSQDLLAAQKESAESHLRRMAEHIAPWGCKVTTRVIVGTVTWQAIVDFAAAGEYDLIAMATHGRGGAARFLLGSVADKVMRSSPVPTLLFHPSVGSGRREDAQLGIEEKLTPGVLVDQP